MVAGKGFLTAKIAKKDAKDAKKGERQRKYDGPPWTRRVTKEIPTHQ